jgi:uncharacterized delta-60 repeat protein
MKTRVPVSTCLKVAKYAVLSRRIMLAGFVAAEASVLAQVPVPDDFMATVTGFGISSIAEQADRQIIVAGDFTALGGQPRASLGRLNSDGSLDLSFAPVPFGSDPLAGQATALALQPDGKILVGGWRRFGPGVQRLNPNGSLDSSFQDSLGGSSVTSLALQPDGKILVAGTISLIGTPERWLCRLNADGTLDASFNPTVGLTNYYPWISALAVQPDGKILLSGSFDTLNGQPRNGFGRLNPEGSLDVSFTALVSSGDTLPLSVRAIAVQPDGKILVGGDFTLLDGQPRGAIGRLNPNGTLDTGFDAGVSVGNYAHSVYSLALQADGKILVGGSFISMGGESRTNLARLNPDGSCDNGFDASTDDSVSLILVQRDGKVMVTGDFGSLGGLPRPMLGRLYNTDPVVENLATSGTTITWSRDGSAPEITSASFSFSTNGSDWISLGAAQRISGGWQISGAALPPAFSLRAQGYAWNSSPSAKVIDAYSGSPGLTVQPGSQTNDARSTVTLSVEGGGSEPLTYQWFKDGQPLADGANISGTGATTLMLSDLLKPDEAGYSVVLSNSFGSVTSVTASLTVLDPAITVQSIGQYASDIRNQYRLAGGSVTFDVTATGTDPLTFQWFEGETAITNATSPSLSLTNLQSSDAGSYSLVVSNLYGMATSASVQLIVAAPVILHVSQSSDGTVTLSWDGNGALFTCDDIACPAWVRLADSSPFTVSPGDGGWISQLFHSAPRYFRVANVPSAEELDASFWSNFDLGTQGNNVQACEACVAAYLASQALPPPSAVAEEAANDGIALGSCISVGQLRVLSKLRLLYYGP